MMRALPLWLIVCLASSDREARAIPPPNRVALGAPLPVAGEHRVARELWRLDCARLLRTGRCETILTMQLEGEVTLDVPVGDDPVTVTIDGEAVALGEPAYGDMGERHHRLVIPGGIRTLVVTRSQRVAHDARGEFLIFPADETRHLLMHDGRSPSTYAVQIVGTYAPWRLPGYTMGVEVSVDPALTWSPFGSPEVVGGWRAAGALRRLELTPDPSLPPERSHGGADVTVLVRLEDEGELVHLGGLALGLGLGSEDGADYFLARLEYEIAIADFILPGLSLDMSSRGLVLTPRVEVSSPVIALIPSIWAGVGMPIRLETDPDLGARLMGGLQFGPIGGLVSVDLRPGDGGLRTELGVLVRLSL